MEPSIQILYSFLSHDAKKNTRLGIMKYPFSPHSAINSPTDQRQITDRPPFSYS